MQFFNQTATASQILKGMAFNSMNSPIDNVDKKKLH